MNVLTYSCGHLSYGDGSTVTDKLNSHFKFGNLVSVDSNLNIERYGRLWLDNPENGNLTLINYHKEVFKFRFRDCSLIDMPPISRDLLEKLSLDRCHLYNMHRDERLTFRELDGDIQNCFQYWNYILDRFSIDLFICHGFPHAIHTYSLYALCKAKGIDVLYVARACMQGYTYVHDDIFAKFDRLEKAYADALKEGGPYPLSDYMKDCYVSKMANDAFKFIAMKKESGRGPKASKKKTEKILSIASSLIKIHRWKHYIGIKHRAIVDKRMPKKTEDYYRKISCPADYTARFIYVPLQQQPEATTSPMGNVFVDLFYMVKTLSHSVKDTDILLYVKEHRDQRRVLRLSRRKLYDDLRTLPNVRLIDMDESTYTLQERCVASATCSGTIIMESMFKGKPVLVFGNRINNLAPSSIIVSDAESCKAAIDDILEGRFSIGGKEREAFLYAVEKACFRGFWFSKYAEDFGLSQDESSENVYLELKRRIEALIE